MEGGSGNEEIYAPAKLELDDLEDSSKESEDVLQAAMVKSEPDDYWEGYGEDPPEEALAIYYELKEEPDDWDTAFSKMKEEDGIIEHLIDDHEISNPPRKPRRGKKKNRLLAKKMDNRRRIANETPEQREIRLEKGRIAYRKRLENESPEEKEKRVVEQQMASRKRRARDKLKKDKSVVANTSSSKALYNSRKNESLIGRERRLEKERTRKINKRLNETPAEREIRREKARVAQKKRRIEATPEERAKMLEKGKLRMRQRRMKLSAEEKERTRDLTRDARQRRETVKRKQ